MLLTIDINDPITRKKLDQLWEKIRIEGAKKSWKSILYQDVNLEDIDIKSYMEYVENAGYIEKDTIATFNVTPIGIKMLTIRASRVR